MTLSEELRSRILVLDGAMGTMLQRGWSEAQTLAAYVEAGADIITTNSFTANRISMPEAPGRAAEVARAA
ncbi:MAG: homocysteine S-methyltransferase family protein, partial [Bacteroidales bacterium]|nr:homocysteine S-methyltransferase family protein [Bacteroidales bacterium]